MEIQQEIKNLNKLKANQQMNEGIKLQKQKRKQEAA